MTSDRVRQTDFQNRLVAKFRNSRVDAKVIDIFSELAIRLNDSTAYPPLLPIVAQVLADIVNELNTLPAAIPYPDDASEMHVDYEPLEIATPEMLAELATEQSPGLTSA